ncbi:metal-dependent hydrolase family protein [Ktedonosporobacter rubrisoli]|nr:amidohydrolase family protein [Ktedonosporobacter rubrisoli]
MLAITNATIIDGTGNDPIENGTLLIEGERISAVGSSNQVSIPGSATVIDAQGANVLPGLIDTHVHFLMEYPNVVNNLLTPPSLRLLLAVPRMRATLDAGITTVRDAGGTPAGVKMAVERGVVAGPRMQVSVSILSQTGGHGDGHYPCCVDLGLAGKFADVPRGVVDGVEEVRKVTREILRAGADWIKLATSGGVLSTADAPTSSQLTVDEIATAVYEAAAQEKRCMAHAQGTQGIKNAIKAGVASIEHGIYLDDEAIEMMLEKGVYLVPTLLAPMAVSKYSAQHPDIVPPMMAAKSNNVMESHVRSFERAVKAGVKIAMGTDSGVGKHGENSQELPLMVKYGMTPMQSIQASTLHAARLLHLDQQLGTLEVGKLADVILVDGDVLSDIKQIGDPANVKLVLKGGQAAKNLLSEQVPLLAGLR